MIEKLLDFLLLSFWFYKFGSQLIIHTGCGDSSGGQAFSTVWEKNETVAGLDSQEKPKGADETSDPKWGKDEPDFY